MNVGYTNSENFDKDVLQSDLPVALDFYSEECSPCAALAPIFKKLAEKYGDRMRFVKILRQQNRELALSLNVKSSPTVLFFSKGQEVGQRLLGYVKKPKLRLAIEQLLGISPEDQPLTTVSADVLILGDFSEEILALNGQD